MSDNKSVTDDICRLAKQMRSPDGKIYWSLSLADTKDIAQQYGEKIRQVEIISLNQNIIPERYQRNIGTLGLTGQATLLSSTVAVIGLGGLGGLVAELLARMGVGCLMLIDGDTFSTNNLNRQLMVSEANLGEQKVAETANRIVGVNEAVEVKVCAEYVDRSRLVDLLKGVQVAVDCLDNLQARFALEAACQENSIPMVHGAIGGYMGQLTVIWPGKPMLNIIYGTEGYEDGCSGEGAIGGGQGRGVEVELGNPATTPAVVAAWEASEAVKVLTNPEEALRGRLMHIDLQSNDVNYIGLSQE